MKLTDILHNGTAETLQAKFANAQAAGDFEALPAGSYTCRIVGGELEASRRNQTPGYKLVFRVLEGEYAGRQVFHDIWLTEAALPMAKRDLGKLGVAELSQLESPLPAGIRCEVAVALRTDDDGTTRNRVRRFDVVGIDKPEVDEFHPDAAAGEGGGDDF